MPGTLYIVATPIGNLEDITSRALDTLKKVDLVLAEDTRVTQKLLMHYEIDLPILSYHQHSSLARKMEILKALVEGKEIALATDAGTPGISDPGNELIDFLLSKEGNIKVIPIPGPSSLTAALSTSGFDVSKFVFLGFLPKKGRTKLFSEIGEGGRTYLFFDSPKRIKKTLTELKEYLDEKRRVFVARELTKMHEETYRGTLEEVTKIMPENPKGEIAVVVEK